MDFGQELKQLMLRAPRLTLAVAESLTCGRLQAAIGTISGGSEFFLGGITTYTIDQKVRHLGVDRAAAEAVNAVSAGIAAQMARGACALFGSDLALATTGYAEPAPDWNVAHPFAFWALAHRRGAAADIVKEGRLERPGIPRVAMQQGVTDTALATLVGYLTDFRNG